MMNIIVIGRLIGVILATVAIVVGVYFIGTRRDTRTTPQAGSPSPIIVYPNPSATLGVDIPQPKGDSTDLNRVREDVYEGAFELQGTMVLNRPVDLVFRVEPVMIDLPNSTVTILLPEQIKLIAGSTSWQGYLRLGARIEQRTTIMVSQPGEWEIRAVVKNPKGPTFERIYYAFLILTETGGELRARPSQREYPTQQPSRNTSP